METRVLKGPNGKLMRTDMVALQSALMQCKGLAERGIKQENIRGEVLEQIIEVAQNAVWVVEDSKEDYEIEDLIRKKGIEGIEETKETKETKE